MIAIFCTILIFACQDDKQDNTGESSESTSITDQKSSPIKKDIKPFKRDPNKRAWSILTADLWHYNFALSVTETPDRNIFEGYWLDFEDDFTYRKGYYDEVVANGEYDFDLDSKVLEMIPTDGDDEPSQWTIKTNGDVIILIGTSKYGNNATQIKLVRERNPPIKR